MDKVNFQDGTKISSAKVTIDEVDYPVTPARYSGATPLSALVLNTMQDNIEDAIDQNISNIGGEEYDETATYEEGDIVKYEGQLYICIEAIDTPEEWDSTKWNATDVLSSAGGNEVTIGAPENITGKTKIFIDEEEGTDAYSEVVNSLSGDEIAKAPSVRAVNEALANKVNLTTYQSFINNFKSYSGISTNVITTTINVNGGDRGKTILAIISGNTSSGDATQSFIYLIRCGYSENNISQSEIAHMIPSGANKRNFTFAVNDNGYMTIQPDNAINWNGLFIIVD